MKKVIQQDRSGCGIACVAMVAGKTYEEVRAAYLARRKEYFQGGMPADFNLYAVGSGAGLNNLEIEDLLAYFNIKGSAVIPFQNPIIRSVASPHGSHWVVIDGNGLKWDPAQE